jgi:hypothetical protein
MRKMAWEQWIDFDNSSELSIDEEMEEGMQLIPIMIRTPLGMFNPSESMSPNKMFDCWIGHTNFPITHKEKYILNNIDGVEILRIMSRYRFFVGIGKLFSLTDVRPKIEIALSINKESAKEKILKEIEGQSFWLVAIYKDGTHKTVLPSKESFEEELMELKLTEPLNIITSEDK